LLSSFQTPYAERSGDPNLANVPHGASLWTFGLFDR
jgi:alcohol dehydrogenase (cytochrome c)